MYFFHSHSTQKLFSFINTTTTFFCDMLYTGKNEIPSLGSLFFGDLLYSEASV
jgi:hypothetical protein